MRKRSVGVTALGRLIPTEVQQGDSADGRFNTDSTPKGMAPPGATKEQKEDPPWLL